MTPTPDRKSLRSHQRSAADPSTTPLKDVLSTVQKIRRWPLAVQEVQAPAFTTFAIPSILRRSRTGRERLQEQPSFPGLAAGHRASIEPLRSKLVWRALSKFLPLTGKGTS